MILCETGPSMNPRKLVPFTSSNSLNMFYLLFVEVDSLYTYVIWAGRGQCILVVVDMITAIFKAWLLQNSVQM
jgi:hypothetical protein